MAFDGIYLFLGLWGVSLTRPVLESISSLAGVSLSRPILESVSSFGKWGLSLKQLVMESVLSFIGEKSILHPPPPPLPRPGVCLVVRPRAGICPVYKRLGRIT